MSCFLKKHNPEKNQHRYYHLHVVRDLFGYFILVREWGRIGQSGTTKETVFDCKIEAIQALKHLEQQKLRKGYQNR